MGAATAGGGAPPPLPTHAFQVYAEGLPFDASEEDVRAFFEPCGAIAALKAPRWQDSGRLRGYAHVTFADVASVARALALGGSRMGSRYVTVAAARAPTAAALGRAPAGCTTLFVRNLPYDAEEGAVRAAFERFGDVASVRIARRYDNLVSKGFGYVQFAARAGLEAAAAGAAAGLAVGGRPVAVDFDAGGGPKASFRGPDGQHVGRLEKREGGGGGKGEKRFKDAGVAAHGAV
jgi:nucleolin